MKFRHPVFCCTCRDFTDYDTSSSPRTITVRGVTFTYPHQSAYCTKCLSEVYVPELNDENVEAKEAAYRKAQSNMKE